MEKSVEDTPTYVHDPAQTKAAAGTNGHLPESDVTLDVEQSHQVVYHMAALKEFAKVATLPLAIIAAASVNSVLSPDGVFGEHRRYEFLMSLAQVGSTFTGITVVFLLIAVQLLPDNPVKGQKTFSSLIVLTILSWFICLFYGTILKFLRARSGYSFQYRQYANGEWNGTTWSDDNEMHSGEIDMSLIVPLAFIVAIFLLSYWAISVVLYRTFFRNKIRLMVVSVGLCLLSVGVFFGFACLGG